MNQPLQEGLVSFDEFSGKMVRAREELKNIENFLRSTIVGQDRAIRRVLRMLHGYYTGLKITSGPIGFCLLAGPSGSGKSYTAEQVARIWLGNTHSKSPPLTRVECGTLGQDHECSLLIGSPPGYVGHGNEPLFSQSNINQYDLTYFSERNRSIEDVLDREYKKAFSEFVLQNKKQPSEQEKIKMRSEIHERLLNAYDEVFPERKPRSVILFDEIEAGPAKLHQMLLHILANGELQLMRGDKTDFRNSLIFLTSNVGTAEVLQGKIGFGQKFQRTSTKDRQTYKDVEQMLEYRFKGIPGLLGRFTKKIVVYRPLTSEDFKKILEIQLVEIQKKLSGAFDEVLPLVVEFSPEVKEFLLQEGFSKRAGVRTLIAVLEKFILDPINDALISERIRPGDGIEFVMQSNEPVIQKSNKCFIDSSP